MKNFSCINGKLEGIRIIQPFFIDDERGFFIKNYEKDIFREFGINMETYEDFETYSIHKVIRGMHFQTKKPQDKLVKVVTGTIRDIVVDLRKESSSFGKWEAIELSDSNHKELWIPRGFAHGFEVLSENAIVSYKCVGKYLKDYDTGIKFCDKELAIEWTTIDPIVSVKDENLMDFSEFKEKYHTL